LTCIPALLSSLDPEVFLVENTRCTSANGRRNELRRNPPLRRPDGEETPLAGHTLELVSAAVVELES